MPTEAELDWMMPVSTAPASTPSRGLVKATKSSRKAGTSPRPETEPDIVSMPNMSVAKPSSTMPVSFLRLSRLNIYIIIPTSASTGVKELGLRSCTHSASPLMPPRLRSQAVTVVPMFAPMMTPIACRRVMSPEFTKPTTMTVVADELWMIEVITRPVRKPVRGLPVILLSVVRRRLPARRSSAWPITFMPKRNRHSPPIISSASKRSIRCSSLYNLHSILQSPFYPPFIKSIISAL